MKSLFSRQTFAYFDLAKKNKKKKNWFEKNRDHYELHVKDPFKLLLLEMSHRLSPKLPGVIISPRKISRPLRPADKAEALGYTKASAMFFLSERMTSMFEWNPGIYMQLGDEKEDNIIGMGLYGPSSRQIKRLRAAFALDHKTVAKLLADRKLRKFWCEPAPEFYKRFPKDYAQDQPGAQYLWYKQFYLRRQFTRKEVVSRGFPDLVLKSFEAGIPLFSWIRNAVGIYDRREMEREKASREDG